MGSRLLKFSLFFLLLLLFACNSSTEEVKVPSAIISQDSMAVLLTDVHLLEAAIDLNLISTAGKQQPDKYYGIFKVHNISRQHYDSSLAFYSEHPELLNKIYDVVIERLSKKQIDLNKH
jgi:hypothetical protein